QKAVTFLYYSRMNVVYSHGSDSSLSYRSGSSPKPQKISIRVECASCVYVLDPRTNQELSQLKFDPLGIGLSLTRKRSVCGIMPESRSSGAGSGQRRTTCALQF